MKMLIGSGGDKLLNQLVTEFGDVEFIPEGSPEEKLAQIRDVDAYYGHPLSGQMFRVAERLRWIQHIGTGIDWIRDLPELVDSDVVLTNCRGPHANPMADHVFGMIISLAHRMWEMRDDQREHHWMTNKYDGTLVDLSGCTLGILGLGDIGIAIARRAQGFDMDVYAVDKHPRTDINCVDAVWGLDQLDRLLSLSDWFIIAAPFTSETEGLIDASRLAGLKRGAYVISISRGGIVDENALVQAMISGQISGVGLDVTAVEPLPDDSPLWDMDNVVISPHASALTPVMWRDREEIFKENLRRFLSGQPFLYICDKNAGF